MKYKDWLEKWLESIVKPTVKMRTYERYTELIISHIIPTIGIYELKDLTPLVLQEYIADLLYHGNLITGEGLSATTVNTIITILHNSLKSAVSFGELNDYVAENIVRPKTQETKVVSFTIAEQKRLEQAIIYHNKDKLFGIILCLYTGLRIGELIALEWNDIDLNKGILRVSKTCHYGKSAKSKYERIVDTPKTASSNREIPLPKQILSILKNLKKNSKSQFVVANGENPITVRSYQRTFALLLKKLKIPHKCFHALRHTFATRALECGMDVKTLSEILGHKNSSITLNRYAHCHIEHKREMMNRLGKLLQ